MAEVIQPKKVFKVLGVTNIDEAQKVMQTTLGFLLYLKPGEKLVTQDAVFEKISADVLHVSSNVDLDHVTDTLQRKKILRFPF